MRLAQAVRVGSWFLVGINLLMAVGTIAILSRMGPAISLIFERNERSVQACEDMLAILAMIPIGTPFSSEQSGDFQTAFGKAKGNITEPLEPAVIEHMEPLLPTLFAGEITARRDIVAAAVRLGKINRDAMTLADRRAQQLGRAGAWGVVFMALSAFLVGVIFIRSIIRRVVTPLEEIHEVIIAQRNGENMRRCVGADLSHDVAAVFTGINDLIDQCQALAAADNRFSDFSR